MWHFVFKINAVHRAMNGAILAHFRTIVVDRPDTKLLTFDMQLHTSLHAIVGIFDACNKHMRRGIIKGDNKQHE